MLRAVVVAGVHLRRSGGTDFALGPVWYRLGLTSGWPPQSPATFFIAGGSSVAPMEYWRPGSEPGDLREEFADHGDEITK
jgi:hypothetical protein